MTRPLVLTFSMLSCILYFACLLHAKPMQLSGAAHGLGDLSASNPGPVPHRVPHRIVLDNPVQAPEEPTHLQKRSSSGGSSRDRDLSGGTYPDRTKLTKKQIERMQRAQSFQRQQEEEAASIVPWNEATIVAHFKQKELNHSRKNTGMRRGDTFIDHGKQHLKWYSRRQAVEYNDIPALQKYYVYYRNKENKPDLDIVKKAKVVRNKNFYGAKLGIAPDTGSSASAGHDTPTTLVPGTPEGGHYYSDVPSTPALDPSQYYAGNWGQGYD